MVALLSVTEPCAQEPRTPVLRMTSNAEDTQMLAYQLEALIDYAYCILDLHFQELIHGRFDHGGLPHVPSQHLQQRFPPEAIGFVHGRED